MRFVTGVGSGWCTLLLGWLLLVVGAAVAMADTQPYEARVVVARAQIRSGPGENFYPTDALERGATVEVYRERPDGWLAIRPPRGSFSWVFGRHLQLRDDRLAETDKDEVASRIGSRFGNQRNAVQVKLRKGELVEILGEEESDGETWYKIEPPAGEFRWILATNVEHARELTATPEDAVAEEVVAASATTETATAEEQPAMPASEEPSQASVDSIAAPGKTWRAAGRGAASTAAEIAPPPLAEVVEAPPVTPGPAPAKEQASQTQAAVTPVGQATDTATRELIDLELRLSRMVAAPPDQWNTERLERDAEELLAQAQTADEREAVKSLLAKLDRFAELARRNQPAAASTGIGTQRTAAAEAPAAAPTRPGAPANDGRYDAVGILRPVVSKRPGAPQFALVDDRGQVISFVTPTPDLNLQPYLGHRVGVVGSRGFIPEFQRAHLTAGRVTPLGERLVR
jgi:uncharacterized protein YgiM (DUF1202 family)